MADRIYINIEDREEGKLYNQDQFGCWEFSEAEYAAYEAAAAAHEIALPKILAQAEIVRLEAEITPRRRDEAILGIDNGWLATQRALIAAERAKLQ